jgi:hypothetical protein
VRELARCVARANIDIAGTRRGASVRAWGGGSSLPLASWRWEGGFRARRARVAECSPGATTTRGKEMTHAGDRGFSRREPIGGDDRRSRRTRRRVQEERPRGWKVSFWQSFGIWLANNFYSHATPYTVVLFPSPPPPPPPPPPLAHSFMSISGSSSSSPCCPCSESPWLAAIRSGSCENRQSSPWRHFGSFRRSKRRRGGVERRQTELKGIAVCRD